MTQWHDFPALHLINLGGESVLAIDVELFRSHFRPPCLLSVRLGSTETNVVRRFFIDHKTTLEGGQVPVGFAVPGTDVVIVGQDGGELGPDQVGEIVIKSRYLALGYWRRPELTRDVFRPDPLDPLRRTYRTGDLGLLRPDGCLLHHGRTDLQVKVRGHRVEVAEIEAALLRMGGFDEAVVVLRSDKSSEPKLTAFLVPKGRGAALPDTEAVRRHLADALPGPMVPSAFHVVAELPLTHSGKIDRKRLMESEIDDVQPAPGERLERAWTPQELSLRGLWAGVLGLERVGLDDNFFEVGGDSLRAMELFSAIETTLGYKLPWTTIYQASTLKSLAVSVLEDPGRLAKASSLYPIRERGATPPLFMVPYPGASRSLLVEAAKLLGSEQVIYGFAYGSDIRVASAAERLLEEIRASSQSVRFSCVGSLSAAWLPSRQPVGSSKMENKWACWLSSIRLDLRTPDWCDRESNACRDIFERSFNSR